MARVYGTARRRDGSKIDGSISISNSWNNATDSPRDGHYSLDLGGNPRHKITLYVDGQACTTVHVDGDTRADIRLL